MRRPTAVPRQRVLPSLQEGSEPKAGVPPPDGRPLRVAGLFAGIGGIEEGLRRAGHQASLLCELDAAARAVLDARFPDVEKHDDIRTLRHLPAGTELLTAGFPCQDLSQAGQTRGIRGNRSGLVHEVFRLIASDKVPWVLLENVSFMLRLDRGRAMSVLVDEFERLGYAWAYRVVDSRAFGLPQRRQRVLFLASRDCDPRTVLLADDQGVPERENDRHWDRSVACGFYWTEGTRGLGWAVNATPTLKGGSTVGIPSPPAIVLPDGEIITPDIRDAEALQGFRRGWTVPATYVSRSSIRWKLVGNAVSVPVAEWVGRKLLKPGLYESECDLPLDAGAPWPTAAWNLRSGRRQSTASTWPCMRSSNLAGFLRHPGVPLSARATTGFLDRATSSTLRFPNGFLEVVRAHKSRVTRA